MSCILCIGKFSFNSPVSEQSQSSSSPRRVSPFRSSLHARGALVGPGRLRVPVLSRDSLSLSRPLLRGGSKRGRHVYPSHLSCCFCLEGVEAADEGTSDSPLRPQGTRTLQGLDYEHEACSSARRKVSGRVPASGSSARLALPASHARIQRSYCCKGTPSKPRCKGPSSRPSIRSESQGSGQSIYLPTKCRG